MISLAIQHLKQDATLRPLLERTQLEAHTPHDDLYFQLVRAIIFQQLSGKAASTIHGRFLALFVNEYPHPEQLAQLDLSTLRTAGVSRQKGGYLQNIAQFWLAEKLTNEQLLAMQDDDLVNYLTQIKGVGKWTVQMLLMFTLDRQDILPLDDGAIQNAMQKLYNFEAKGKQLKQKMTEIAEPWRPYRTLACRYLWAYLDTKV